MEGGQRLIGLPLILPGQRIYDVSRITVLAGPSAEITHFCCLELLQREDNWGYIDFYIYLHRDLFGRGRLPHNAYAIARYAREQARDWLEEHPVCIGYSTGFAAVTICCGDDDNALTR